MKSEDNQLSNMDLEAKLLEIELFLQEHRWIDGWSEIEYQTGLVLLAAVRLGPKPKVISEALDLEASFVLRIAHRMHGSKLWDEVSASTDGWFDDGSFPGFYEHLAVAEGWMVCIETDDSTSFIHAREISSSVM